MPQRARGAGGTSLGGSSGSLYNDILSKKLDGGGGRLSPRDTTRRFGGESPYNERGSGSVIGNLNDLVVETAPLIDDDSEDNTVIPWVTIADTMKKYGIMPLWEGDITSMDSREDAYDQIYNAVASGAIPIDEFPYSTLNNVGFKKDDLLRNISNGNIDPSMVSEDAYTEFGISTDEWDASLPDEFADLSGDADLEGDSNLSGAEELPDIGIETLASGFQGQANDMLEEVLKNSGEDIDVTLQKWLEEQMLGGGGFGIRVNGDGSRDLIYSLPFPLPLPGVGEIQLVDKDGNVTVSTKAIKDHVGQIWENVSSIPGDLIGQAKDTVGELIKAGKDIGGVSSAGDILDIAGNVIGSIFKPEFGAIADSGDLALGELLGNVLNSTSEDLGLKYGDQDQLIADLKQPVSEDPLTPASDVATETVQDNIYPDDGGYLPGTTQEPVVQEPVSAPAVDTTAPEVAQDNIYPDEGGFIPGGTQDAVDQGGAQDDVFSDDAGAQNGAASGGGGGVSQRDGYMGGLSYQLDAPRSVVYDARDPMIQLNDIINRSLFKDII